MSFSTFPNNPFPPSTAQFNEGKNDFIQAEIDAIKDGTNIDSFADVESALALKANSADMTTALATKTNLSNIAPAFDSTSGVYAVGDEVIYNEVLYEFTSAHSTAGEWDESEVQPVKISELIDSLRNGLTGKQDIYGNATKLSEIAADATSATVTATKNGYLSLVYEMTTTNRNISGKIRDGNVVQLGATFNITALAYAGEPICTIPCVNGHIYSVEVSAGHEGISIYQM